MDLEDLFSFDNLYDALWECCRSVGWKNKTKHFKLNAVYEVTRIREQILNGAYHPKRPNTIEIYYPKRRQAMSIDFRDRVVQRAVNDLVLYPRATRSFVTDNAACQKGKGPQFARKRIKAHLWNHYCHYGTQGYVVQIDIHHYYPCMSQDMVKACFRRLVPEDDIYKIVCETLDSQAIDGGYNPGSQMIQIAGIALLDPLDHYIKERLHVRHYVRYMDDFWMVLPTQIEAQRCLDCVVSKLKTEYGFDINPDKTHVRPLSDGFEMLGFRWRLSQTGRVVQNLLPQNVRHERNRLIRMASKGVSRQDAAVSLECWMAHAAEGQNAQSVRRMKQLFNTLYKEARYAETRTQ